MLVVVHLQHLLAADELLSYFCYWKRAGKVPNRTGAKICWHTQESGGLRASGGLEDHGVGRRGGEAARSAPARAPASRPVLALHQHGRSGPRNGLEAARAFVPAARARRHTRRRPRPLVPLAPSRKQQPRPTAVAAAKASAWESGPTRAAATAREGEAAAGRAEEAGHRPGGERPGRRYVRRPRARAARVRHRGLEPQTSRSLAGLLRTRVRLALGRCVGTARLCFLAQNAFVGVAELAVGGGLVPVQLTGTEAAEECDREMCGADDCCGDVAFGVKVAGSASRGSTRSQHRGSV